MNYDNIEIKRKKTLSEVAYDYIKKMIIEGNLKGGDVLTENGIGEALNMSRTPVKRAITRLEQERYVRSVDGIGTIVENLSLKDLTDIYEVRIEIEKLAIRTSIKNLKQKELEKLENEFEQVLSEIRKGNTPDEDFLSMQDEKLHMFILDNSTNSYIKDIYKYIRAQILRYKHEAYALTDTSEESTLYHLEIIRCLKCQDLEGALKIMEEHLRWSYNTLVEELTRLD
ncbi:GntR family transcriptional regulator [Peptoniphilus sp.]|jgi:DNA-binding GntR family transcriptional regulator|uniref:GntR family transcriptional regulator n=1 Tax=Peptoniphilus sp. TaxID=1971214 RepID=UPI003D91C986